MSSRPMKPVLDHVGEIQRVRERLPKAAHSELPPVFYEAGEDRFAVFSTNFAVAAPLKPGRSRRDFFLDEDALDLERSFLATDSCTGCGSEATGGRRADPDAFNGDDAWKPGYPYWKRQYHGIFDCRTVDVDGRSHLVFILHGENKNERQGEIRCINSIRPKKEYRDDEFSGAREIGGKFVYHDNPDTYFAFTSMLVVPTDRCGRFFDLPAYDGGPIVWPQRGYIDEGGAHADFGIRHPRILVHEEHLYVFYIERSLPRVIRARTADLLEPNPFLALSNGTFSKPALPEGFDRASRAFFPCGIGETDALFDDSGSISFNVAKVRGRDLFLGAEDYWTGQPMTGLRFRVSPDLVHWSDAVPVPSLERADYNEGTIHYPILCDRNFENADGIDLEDFTVVGVYGNNIGQPSIEFCRFGLSVP